MAQFHRVYSYLIQDGSFREIYAQITVSLLYETKKRKRILSRMFSKLNRQCFKFRFRYVSLQNSVVILIESYRNRFNFLTLFSEWPIGISPQVYLSLFRRIWKPSRSNERSSGYYRSPKTLDGLTTWRELIKLSKIKINSRSAMSRK